LALAGCAETSKLTGPGDGEGGDDQPKLTLQQVSYRDVPGWHTDRHNRALAAFRRSCPKLGFAWSRACQALAAVPRGNPEEARLFFERYFDPHLVTNFGGKGFLTGYYEPVLKGARRRGGKYRTPLHLPPPDLAKRKPYPTRAQLLAPPLRDKLPALVWLADPVDAFTLHIQGSGRIQLARGGVMRVGVAGTNGHGYVSIGRIMLREGKLKRKQASMQGIQAWLRANPRQAQALMNRNPRYIFFRENKGDGPIGTQGVALTPRRSLAVDKRYIPLGMPVWLDSNWPGGKRPMRRLVIAQDTGIAIVGPVRGDLFMGAGPRALAVAGRMRQQVRFFVFVPRGATIAASPADLRSGE
jgi:membrane-bound lytic murein transglycosylase A